MCVCVCVCVCVSHSIMSISLPPHGLWPARLLCLWDSPGKDTGASCHFLLQGGDLLDPGIKPGSPALASRFFPAWATREALIQSKCFENSCPSMANSSFALWNFLDFLKNIFYPWLTKFIHVDPTHTEGQLCLVWANLAASPELSQQMPFLFL